MDGMEAPGLNAVLGQSGACPEISDNGKTWKIAHPTQQAKAILNVLIVQRASEEIETQGKNLPPGVSARMFDSLTKMVVAKHFHTWHPGWLEAVGSQDGDILFLLSLLKINHPTATEADAFTLYANCPGKVKIALAQVMPPFFDLLEPDFPPQVEASQRAELMEGLRKKYLLPPEPST